MNNKIAYKCLECKIINVYPEQRGDGNTCVKCGGPIAPIGEAVVYQSSNKNSITVSVNVDTTELDIALDKAREIERIYDKVNKEIVVDIKIDGESIYKAICKADRQRGRCACAY